MFLSEIFRILQSSSLRLVYYTEGKDLTCLRSWLKDVDPVGQRPRTSDTPWQASTLPPVCSPATASTETCPPVRSRWNLCSAVTTTPSDTNRSSSPSASTWQPLPVAVEPKDYGSTSSLALLHLFTSPSLNQPALLTGVSSRRKQTHLFGLQTQRKLKKLINLDHLTSLLLSTPLCCTGFYSLGQMDKPRQSGQIPRRKTFEN